MAVNEIHIDASPETLFEVLRDPDSYGHWVVGSKRVRDADREWPAPGSRFHHTVGFGPLTLDDHTLSLRAEPPRLLELRTKARPLGTAHVCIECRAEGTGALVTMREDAGDKLTALLFNPLTHLLVRGRNAESLRRLARLAEKRHREQAK